MTDIAAPHPIVTAACGLLTGWLERTASPEALTDFTPLLQGVMDRQSEWALVRALGLAPRILGRAKLQFVPADAEAANALHKGFDPTGLTSDQIARILLILASYRGDDPAFAQQLQALRRTSELNEAIAYYRGLAIFPAREELRPFAGEGIRSSVAPVFEAVAHRNPYPREMFDQAAWNQMVLKALFVGASLVPIQGLDERANPELVLMLIDHACERWAAGRLVDPELWRCVWPFVDERERQTIVPILRAGSLPERLAVMETISRAVR